MKIVSALQAGTTTDSSSPIGESVRLVCSEPSPGFLLKIALSAQGVTIFRGEAAVRVPLDVLADLARTAEPDLNWQSQPPQ